jgi:hypothetical protein
MLGVYIECWASFMRIVQFFLSLGVYTEHWAFYICIGHYSYCWVSPTAWVFVFGGFRFSFYILGDYRRPWAFVLPVHVPVVYALAVGTIEWNSSMPGIKD